MANVINVDQAEQQPIISSALGVLVVNMNTKINMNTKTAKAVSQVRKL